MLTSPLDCRSGTCSAVFDDTTYPSPDPADAAIIVSGEKCGMKQPLVKSTARVTTTTFNFDNIVGMVSTRHSICWCYRCSDSTDATDYNAKIGTATLVTITSPKMGTFLC
eukprot:GHVL01000556.1.p1 GENE.GHVL01000556.1~~GHVL01000556.1.p1  ORF type:complete len:110 (+),score=15.66 GHVL01000556.1:480-809(+)